MMQARKFNAKLAVLAVLGAVWLQIFCSPKLTIDSSLRPAQHPACPDSETDSRQHQTPASPASKQRCCTAPDLFISTFFTHCFTPTSLTNDRVNDVPLEHHLELVARTYWSIQAPSDQPVLRI